MADLEENQNCSQWPKAGDPTVLYPRRDNRHSAVARDLSGKEGKTVLQIIVITETNMNYLAEHLAYTACSQLCVRDRAAITKLVGALWNYAVFLRSY